MHVLDGDETATQLDGLVHLDTQRADYGIDLTAGAVYRLTGGGQLDFGGSEFEPAPRETLTPELANSDDDYGWWTLEAGTYIIRYNETPALDPNHWAQVVPHPRLLQAGLHHPTFVVANAPDAGPLETPLFVGPSGGRLKENGRISRLIVFNTG